LNFWWIPTFGIWGAAWATVVAYGVWTAGVALLSLRLYPVLYPVRHIGMIVLSGALGYVGLCGIDKALIVQAHVLLGVKVFWVFMITGSVGLKIWYDHGKSVRGIKCIS